MKLKKQKILDQNDPQSLTNVGPALAKRLHAIGIKTTKQILESDPELLYRLLKRKEPDLDICVLYQLRGAICNSPWWKCTNKHM